MIDKKHKYMTIGLLAITGSFLFTGGTATAGSKPPWIIPETGITKAQRFIAARLKKALAIERRKQPFYKSASSIKWSTTRRNYGISNIDTNNINKLFSGHYFVAVYRPPGNKKYLSTERISVAYFGKDGRYVSCWSRVDGGSHRYSARWKPTKNTIGFGAWNTVEYKTSKVKNGPPMIYDGYSGRTLMYYNPGDRRSHPIKFIGHFQKEYAPVFKAV